MIVEIWVWIVVRVLVQVLTQCAILSLLLETPILILNVNIHLFLVQPLE